MYSCNPTARRLGIEDVLRAVNLELTMCPVRVNLQGLEGDPYVARLSVNRGKIDPKVTELRVVGSNLKGGGSISA